MHTVGRFVYSLHITVGVYNCREDRIFISRINLQIVDRQGSLTSSKSTKSTTWEKAFSFHAYFLLISRQRGVLRCWWAVLRSWGLHCTAVSEESWGGALGDPQRQPPPKVKLGRRLEEKNLCLKFSDPGREQHGAPEDAAVDQLCDKVLILRTARPGFWSTNWREWAA